MKILVKSDGTILDSGYNFIFGAWEEQDKCHGTVVRKWKKVNGSGDLLGYRLDENPVAITGTEKPCYQVFEVEELPDGWETGKYLYQNDAFILNPDWTEPKPTQEEEIAKLKETIAELAEEIQLLNDTLLEMLMG